MKREINLSAKKNKNGSYSFFLQYCNEGVYLKTTGINGLYLNKTQLEFFQNKKKLPSTVPNYAILNEKLNSEMDNLDGLVNKYLNTYQRYPTKVELESYLRYCNPTVQTEKSDFIDCFKRFIDQKEKSKNIKQYVTLLHHFERFLIWKGNKKDIYFSDLQKEFFKEFFTFLSQKSKLSKKSNYDQKIDVSDNAILKLSYNLAAAIKGFQKYKLATINENEIVNNIHLAIEELNVTPYTNIELVLSHHEIEQLANFKLHDEYRSGKYIKGDKFIVSAEVLERIKFLFILQTTKGTRHSDLHQICLDNLVDNRINILQKKTKYQYSVNIDELTISLMEKSHSDLEISNQKYNEYLKLVFKQFFPYYKENFKSEDISYKLDNIPIIKYYLGKKVITYKKRYELAKTHTARRTYVSVGKIKHKLTDLEIQHDIGQTNPNSLKPYKIYYEEEERTKVFDFKIEE